MASQDGHAHTEEAAGAEQKEQLQTKNRVCDYYISARGCVKGDSCDFDHPLAPSGASTNRVCDFHGTARGCVKGATCDFLHPRRINPRGEETSRVCDFFLTPQGCVKGSACDFAHPRAMPSGGAMRPGGGFGAVGAVGGRGLGRGGAASAVRVCEFYLTPAGCNRGNACNFSHPTGRAAQQALAAKEAAAAGRGGRAMAAGGQQTAPICDYFFSRRGCSKGNACPFSHTAHAPAAAFGSYSQPHQPHHQPQHHSQHSQHQHQHQHHQQQQHGSAADAARRAPKVCAFYSTEKGCVKGRQCDFVHVEDKVCDFYLSERGCKKGQHCNFKHAKDEQAAPEADY